ncbi:MAG: type II toxin-antitoxin system VapC family toxin [Chloroflexota bacterium]
MGHRSAVKLDDALVGVARLGIDTAPVIYFIEAHARFERVVAPIFKLIADGRLIGITSTITLTEVLVQPFMSANVRLQQEYRDILLYSPNFEVVPIDLNVAERAAELRARYGLRAPDALQIAAALSSGCEAFVTNDSKLQRVSEL